jgi:hypothetical protein
LKQASIHPTVETRSSPLRHLFVDEITKSAVCCPQRISRGSGGRLLSGQTEHKSLAGGYSRVDDDDYYQPNRPFRSSSSDTHYGMGQSSLPSILHSLFSHFLARLGADAIRWEPWNCGAQWSLVRSFSCSRIHTNAFHVGRLANCHGNFWFNVNLSSLIILCFPRPFANDDMPLRREWSLPPQASTH